MSRNSKSFTYVTYVITLTVIYCKRSDVFKGGKPQLEKEGKGRDRGNLTKGKEIKTERCYNLSVYFYFSVVYIEKHGLRF